MFNRALNARKHDFNVVENVSVTMSFVPHHGTLSHVDIDNHVKWNRPRIGHAPNKRHLVNNQDLDEVTEAHKIKTDHSFGKQVTKARSVKKMSQSELANMCNVKVREVSQIESGTLPVKRANALKPLLMRKLGIHSLKAV